ncbi:MAG TPA: DoxX family protein [Aldersonia sp.]
MTASVASTTTTAISTPTVGRKGRIAGRVVTVLLVAFLLFDAVIHIALPDFVRESFEEVGLATYYGPVIGVVMLVCLALYLVPATALLGGILLTGYLGGAVATNMLTEQPLFSTILFPVYVGIVAWIALWLRDGRVRAIFPVLPR